MKRRTFLRGIAAAFAIGMSPAFLNTTKLEIIGLDLAKGDAIGTTSLFRIHSDGIRELISAVQNPIVDDGVNGVVSLYGDSDHIAAGMPFDEYPRQMRFMVPKNMNIEEMGVGTDGKHNRIVLKEPITVESDDVLEIEYEYRIA